MRGYIHYGDEDYAVEAEVGQEPMPDAHFKALVRLAYFAVSVAGCVAAIWLVGKDALLPIIGVAFIGMIAALVKWGLNGE